MLRINETKIVAKINFKSKATNMSMSSRSEPASVIDTKFTL